MRIEGFFMRQSGGSKSALVNSKIKVHAWQGIADEEGGISYRDLKSKTLQFQALSEQHPVQIIFLPSKKSPCSLIDLP